MGSNRSECRVLGGLSHNSDCVRLTLDHDSGSVSLRGNTYHHVPDKMLISWKYRGTVGLSMKGAMMSIGGAEES
jgi:hypothetical protein